MKDKEQNLIDLNKKNEILSKELETVQKSAGNSASPDVEKLKELESALAESKDEGIRLSESVDLMKKKNNVRSLS